MAAPGTFIEDMTLYEDASSCDQCPKGTFCFGGAAQPEPCGVGTIAASTGTAKCTRCAPGSYQDTRGKSQCNDCNAGFYCAEGAATPIRTHAGARTLPPRTSAALCLF